MRKECIGGWRHVRMAVRDIMDDIPAAFFLCGSVLVEQQRSSMLRNQRGRAPWGKV